MREDHIMAKSHFFDFPDIGSHGHGGQEEYVTDTDTKCTGIDRPSNGD